MVSANNSFFDKIGLLGDDCSNAYRFGFNGKEKDTEGEWGTQTHYDYGFRIPSNLATPPDKMPALKY